MPWRVRESVSIEARLSAPVRRSADTRPPEAGASVMKIFNRIYINGRFVTPHGTETLTLVDPTTEEAASIVTLADVEDTRAAIAAAKAAYAEYRSSTLAERGAYLQRLHDAVTARMDEQVEAIVAEYGGTPPLSPASARPPAPTLLPPQKTIEGVALSPRPALAPRRLHAPP